ncbi:uncharacterized protein N7483_007470 [Penicillium malachiteum]|uniref:uncharacterized protein n=1 Tax=Penicillium malachiteum TaxID=1324776 RepID=UPI0025474EAD|nr:uncharacterized protein N7483_007470 [Penicillium malachiteum]KAJ5726113.1 hypothetical protein N7483_007470 [Penicillium malachiteum]
MSDFFRRASDAFHHRPRQDSTGSTSSTEAAIDSSAAKAPDQQPLNPSSQTVQPQPQSGSYAGTTTAKPKPHHLWGWKHGQENKTDPSQISAQKKDDTDWVVGT